MSTHEFVQARAMCLLSSWTDWRHENQTDTKYIDTNKHTWFTRASEAGNLIKRRLRLKDFKSKCQSQSLRSLTVKPSFLQFTRQHTIFLLFAQVDLIPPAASYLRLAMTLSCVLPHKERSLLDSTLATESRCSPVLCLRSVLKAMKILGPRCHDL